MRFGYLVFTALLSTAGIAAHADTFHFSFGSSSSAFSGSGDLTTGTAEAPGEYLIAGVTGTVATSPNGSSLTIASILAPDVFPTVSNGGTFPANDNTLFVTNGLGTLSQDGLSFSLQNGAQINLYNDGSGLDALLERMNGAIVNESVPVSIASIATTPEPSSFVLLGTGLLGLGSLTRRRKI